MDINEWVIEVKKGMKNMTDNVGVMALTSVELDKLKNRSIYKVPDHVAGTEKKLYKPQMVSLGPYNHNEKNDMQRMVHKTHTLHRFLHRSNEPLESFVEAMSKELESLKEAYYPLELKWHEEGSFLKMMILDGCFILEVMNVYAKNFVYAPDDPVFGIHVLPLIKRDLLLLENQVPFRVIRILLGVAEGQVGYYRDKIPDELLYLLFRFFSTPTSSFSSPVWSKISEMPCLHLLDVYREILIYDIRISNSKQLIHTDNVHFPSASKLYEAGIRFDRSPSTHLKDISFKGSTLIFPAIVIADETISTLANLMAFERVHSSAVNDVTTYVFFMTCLIQNAEDVSLLKSSGIIQNTFRNDEDVAKSLRLLSRDFLLGPNNMLDEVYQMVSHKLRSGVKKTLNEWWVDLFRTYFKTPWGVFSLSAALILFTLTIIQTVYTMLSYIHPK